MSLDCVASSFVDHSKLSLDNRSKPTKRAPARLPGRAGSANQANQGSTSNQASQASQAGAIIGRRPGHCAGCDTKSYYPLCNACMMEDNGYKVRMCPSCKKSSVVKDSSWEGICNTCNNTDFKRKCRCCGSRYSTWEPWKIYCGPCYENTTQKECEDCGKLFKSYLGLHDKCLNCHTRRCGGFQSPRK